jgi:hypothetical protein
MGELLDCVDVLHLLPPLHDTLGNPARIPRLVSRLGAHPDSAFAIPSLCIVVHPFLMLSFDASVDGSPTPVLDLTFRAGFKTLATIPTLVFEGLCLSGLSRLEVSGECGLKEESWRTMFSSLKELRTLMTGIVDVTELISELKPISTEGRGGGVPLPRLDELVLRGVESGEPSRPRGVFGTLQMHLVDFRELPECYMVELDKVVTHFWYYDQS